MLRLEQNKFVFNFQLFLTTGNKKFVEVKIQFIHYYLQNTMDIINYFCPSDGDMLDGRTLNSTTPGAS